MVSKRVRSESRNIVPKGEDSMRNVCVRMVGLGVGAIAFVGVSLGISARLGAQSALLRQETLEERIVRGNERLGYKGSITGRVMLDDGKPVSGIKVAARIQRDGPPVRGFSPDFGIGSAITDENGFYRIRGLRPIKFQVALETTGKPYLVGSPRTVDLRQLPKGTVENINFTVYLGTEITVRIRDAETGEPTPGIIVNSRSPDSYPIGVTDAKGEFRFPTATSNLVLELTTKQGSPDIGPAPGYQFYRQFTVPQSTNHPGIIWEVKTYNEPSQRPLRVLRGVVTDTEGKPVSGASLRLTRRMGGELKTTTDAEGRFAIETARMSPWEWENQNGVWQRGMALQVTKGKERTLYFPTPEETWTTMTIPLKSRLATILGQVISPEGKPLAGLPISFAEGFSDVTALVVRNGGTTDAEGRFRITDVDADACCCFTFGGIIPAKYLPEREYAPWAAVRQGEARDLGRIVIRQPMPP